MAVRARIPETTDMASSVPTDGELRFWVDGSMRHRPFAGARRFPAGYALEGCSPAFRFPSPFPIGAGFSEEDVSARSGAAPDFGSKGGPSYQDRQSSVQRPSAPWQTCRVAAGAKVD